MSEKNDRPKPPTRRTGGRTLGGAKKTAPPPPPPAAELTPEQFVAEQTATHDAGRPASDESRVQRPSTAPVATAAQDDSTGMHPEAPQSQAPAAQPTRPAAVDAAVRPVPSAHSTQRQEQFVARAPESPAPAGQSTQMIEQVPQAGPAQATSTTSGVSPAAEVAVRPAASPVPSGTAFPVRTDAAGSHREQNTRSEATPSEGTPWAQGPGRPKDIPETAAVLNQRIITRESLDSSVPAALKLKRRIKRFALDNELDHLPIGDIVAVALDEWLTNRGF
ncbi:hypothetical protein OHB35_11340 [Streptomyces phaeochromogenes]|uniref:Uncharacterized protein n=1 Tax=Streptomyces phaeochromogenes TaxID=1923 RepID=A0ABZ1H5E8_STRPH|nr:hypothetical protein [Streptomyces phaeochromogenes]WSD13786.1 hypothetical protein OHB35_11340 [Streptomyces phaeochromogenes]